MSGPSIELSPKYGVNPTMPICFWCGKETGEIALVGRITNAQNNDCEAPKSAVIDYEPCHECKDLFDLGIVLFEAVNEPTVPNQPAIGPDSYPTGPHMVVTREGCQKIFEQLGVEQSTIDRMLEAGQAALDPYVFNIISQGAEHANDA